GRSLMRGLFLSRRPVSDLGWEAAVARTVVAGAGRVGDGGLPVSRLGRDAAVRRPVVAEGRAGPTGASTGRVPAIPYPVAGIRREVASAEAPSVPSASPASGPHLASPTFQEVARAVAAETMSDVRPVLALDRALAVRRSVNR